MRLLRNLLLGIGLAVFVMGLSQSVSAQQSASKAKKKANDPPELPLVNSVITYNHESFDFGSVPPGTRVSHLFPVKNDGSDTLVISKIKAG